jgi:hypothetical protein
MTAGLNPQSSSLLGLDDFRAFGRTPQDTCVPAVGATGEPGFLQLTPQIVNKERETKSDPILRSKIGKASTSLFLSNSFGFGEKRWTGKKSNFFAT